MPLFYKLRIGREAGMVRPSKEYKNNASFYEPLFEVLENGGHLSPANIRYFLGEDMVKPWLLVDAAYINRGGRRANVPAIYHFINTLVRPDYLGLGFSNERYAQKVSIVAHDLPEDIGVGIGGNYAVTRFLGQLFGDEIEGIEGSSEALTNFRNTMYKQLEAKLKGEPRQDEVVKELSDLIEEANLIWEQTGTHLSLESSFNKYLAKLPNFVKQRRDKEETEEIIQSFLATNEQLSSDLIPNEIIRSNVKIFFENLKFYASDSESLKEDSNCQIPIDRPSVLMHNIDHLQYSGDNGSYLNDLFSYAVKNTDSLATIGLDTMLSKWQENADNLRIETDNSPPRQHMAYFRSRAICKGGDDYLRFINNVRPDDYQKASLVLKFLKGELLRRVITDFGHADLHVDTTYNLHKRWLIKQFEIISDYVGSKGEEFLKRQLKAAAFSDNPNIAESSINELRAYARLSNDDELAKTANTAENANKAK